jgi:hypothetical protein
MDLYVTKTETEKRRTTGVLYVPSAPNAPMVDSQGDFITEDDLEDAVAEYVKAGDLDLRLQHNRRVVAGRVIGIMAWPYEHEVELSIPGGVTKQVKLPKGTVHVTVEWNPDAWHLVKSGKLTGFSLGGKATKIENAGRGGTPMGAGLRKAAGEGLVAGAMRSAIAGRDAGRWSAARLVGLGKERIPAAKRDAGMLDALSEMNALYARTEYGHPHGSTTPKPIASDQVSSIGEPVTISSVEIEVFLRRVLNMRQAFFDSEQRWPTGDDAEFVTAYRTLYDELVKPGRRLPGRATV